MKDTHTPTYEGRHQERVRIRERSQSTIHTETLDGEPGWSWGGHATLSDLEAGAVILVETVRFSEVVGVAVDGEAEPDPESSNGWRFRKSDQELAAAHAAYVHALDRKREQQLRDNAADWAEREAQLPEWLRERIGYFHASGGHHFDVDGWGYELTICELAALYDADDDWKAAAAKLPDGARLSSLPDPAPVMDYAHREGTSGNQHGMAMSLVMAHQEDPSRSMAGTVSALSPLTGDPDYSGDGGPDVAGEEEERPTTAGYVRFHLQVDDDGNEVVLEHPLSWLVEGDPDVVSAYGERALKALADADLLWETH